LREEHRLRIFENRVLRRIFGPKRELDGSCRILHNDEHHSLYSSPNIVRGDELDGICSTHGRGELFTRFRLEGPKGKGHWEDQGIGGRITLIWTLGR
jgi:hypothetical protein